MLGMRSMSWRRQLPRVAAFVTLGIATTLAICWTAAAFLPLWTGWGEGRFEVRDAPEGAKSDVARVTLQHWPRVVGTSWSVSWGTNRPPVRGAATSFFAPSVPSWVDRIIRPWQRSPDDWPEYRFPTIPYAVTAADVRAYGFPALAMFRCQRVPMDAPLRWEQRGWLAVPHTFEPDRLGVGVRGPVVLPLLIHWPGFVFDACVWSAAWWGVLVLGPAVRARRRRARGLCVACGYALSGLGADSGCPECGRVGL